MLSMYASSSRVFSKLGTASSRTFSTTSQTAARREAFVELLDDVKGLGSAFDRLFVAPGRARNDLVPNRKARFIPFKSNSERQALKMTAEERQNHHLRITEPSSVP